MSTSHLIFIPGVMLIGIVLGYVMGTRAARAAMDAQRKRSKE